MGRHSRWQSQRNTVRRWQRFGQSGAKLIWGGEAVAVCHDGRANPNQLVVAPHTERGLAHLREALIEEHRTRTGSDRRPAHRLATHAFRPLLPSRTCTIGRAAILYHHPILDRRLGLPADYPVAHRRRNRSASSKISTAPRAWRRELGFDFVDIKHCHGYLGHEFLSARTREGHYGGSFENRTRFLREIVRGIRAIAPGLKIGVRLSAFDTVPFRPDPALQSASWAPELPRTASIGSG